MFPELVQASAAGDAAQRQNIFCAGQGPEHAGLFAACADDRFASSLHDTRTDKVPCGAKGAILHALDIALKISQFLLDGLSLRLTTASLASFFNQRLNLVFEQSLGPTALLDFMVRMVFAPQGVEHSARVFHRVVKIHDLHAVLEAVFAPALGASAASARSAAPCKRHSTTALCGLKMAVRTKNSNSCTSLPCGVWPSKRAINCWISSSRAMRTCGARSFF